MIALHAQTLADAAEHLHDDEIHVWQVAYQRQHGREPLRATLAAYLGIDTQDVTLTDGEHGRPALCAAHDPSLGFNWSHSGQHALIAIGRGITPGIDLELLRARPNALEIAERFFSADEIALLAALAPIDRDVAFLELWTAKEAVLKALGRGIAFGLHRLSIVRNGDQLHLHRLDGEDVQAWQLQRLYIDAAQVAALAWRGDKRSIRLCTLAKTA
ncbi:MAG TPA: 4'-phosphopantetheinyl transferase superfamily protein [Rhodanobacter sp.]